MSKRKIVKRGRVVRGMTEKEVEILDTLVACDGNLTSSADILGISVSAASQRLTRLSLRIQDAKYLIERAREYRIRLPGRWF